MKKIVLFLLTTLALFGAESILEQVDKKLSPSSADSYKKLINIEPDGSKKEFLLYQIKKGKDKIPPVVENKQDLDEVTYRVTTYNDYLGMIQFLQYLEHLPQFTEITKTPKVKIMTKAYRNNLNM